MQPDLSHPAAPPPPDTIAQIAEQPHAANPTKNEIYATICAQIIKNQGLIIGALTYEQATQVPGLQVDPVSYTCKITGGDGAQILGALVEKYREFFGNAAVEVCREAAAQLARNLTNEDLPPTLRTGQ